MSSSAVRDAGVGAGSGVFLSGVPGVAPGAGEVMEKSMEVATINSVHISRRQAGVALTCGSTRLLFTLDKVPDLIVAIQQCALMVWHPEPVHRCDIRPGGYFKHVGSSLVSRAVSGNCDADGRLWSVTEGHALVWFMGHDPVIRVTGFSGETHDLLEA